MTPWPRISATSSRAFLSCWWEPHCEMIVVYVYTSHRWASSWFSGRPLSQSKSSEALHSQTALQHSTADGVAAAKHVYITQLPRVKML